MACAFRGGGFLAAAALLDGCAPAGPDHLLPTRTAEGFQARQYIPPVDILELEFYQDDAGVHAFVLLTSDDEYTTSAPLYMGVEYVSPKGRIIGSSTRIVGFQWVGQEVAVTMMAAQDTLSAKDVAGDLIAVTWSCGDPVLPGFVHCLPRPQPLRRPSRGVREGPGMSDWQGVLISAPAPA